MRGRPTLSQESTKPTVNNEAPIRSAFEQALLSGLKGAPLTNKEGALLTDTTGEMILATPEASFLSVVRAYLKDLSSTSDTSKVPATGKPREGGLLDQFQKSKLPFGLRPQ